MRVRRLEIERFRGVRVLDWRHIGDTSALVGPGDSGKTSVLDAIERVLSPRWSVRFDDSDFWNSVPDDPIVIRCTLTDIPRSFFKDTKYGLVLHGFDSADGVAVAATGDDEEEYALVIELRVDASLEPVWSVIDSEDTAHPIRAKDREALGMLRVGEYLDAHLGWSRGSILARVTESGDSVGAVLAEASRKARSSLDLGDLTTLTDAANRVEQAGRSVGAAVRTGLGPHLDVGAVSAGSGALTLHDGSVPLRRAGLGTRRLFAVAMQQDASGESGLTLIDEFEHGLEPHRIRRLLRVLRGAPPETEKTGTGQLILTTHSPTVLSELERNEVFVAKRSSDGSLDITCLPDELGYVLNKVPEALLARKVVVGEGATEAGLCRGLDDAWTEELDGDSFAYRGVVVVDGLGGTQPAEIAGRLSKLGYTTALVVDSDATAKTSRAKDAQVLAWPGGVSTEERLALDLPIEAVRALTTMATSSRKAGSVRAVRDALAAGLGIKPADLQGDPDEWVDCVDEDDYRRALGAVAKDKGWFKSVGMGRRLGHLVNEHWDAVIDEPAGEVLGGLSEFVRDE